MENARILVVDDEADIREITAKFLKRRNHTVFTASNTKEALELLEKEKPQVMLLDLRLGEESGMDILRQAKEIDKNIKVIMVTALGDEETINQAKSLGADDYITKPFTASFLNDLILKK